MKDRINPCIHYVCAHEDCKKGFHDVTLKKCKNCTKYHGRKGVHKESLSNKRQKDKDRHDNWKNY